MKKLFILLGVLVGLSSVSFAQEQEGKKAKGKKSMKREWKKDFSPEDMANKRTEHLDKIVSLSEEQKEQVYALTLENAQKAKERKDVTRKDREIMRQRFKAHQEAMNNILTAEQQELLKEQRVAARKDYQPRGKRNFEGKRNYRKPVKDTENKIEG